LIHQKRADKSAENQKVNPKVKPGVRSAAGDQAMAHISAFLKLPQRGKAE
jgi:hypothetical protein